MAYLNYTVTAPIVTISGVGTNSNQIIWNGVNAINWEPVKYRPTLYLLRYRKKGGSWSQISFDNELERSGYMSCLTNHLKDMEMETQSVDSDEDQVWPLD